VKIALTAPLYTLGSDGAGGIGTFVSLLAKNLTQRGHSVDVFTVADSIVDGHKVAVRDRSIFDAANDNLTPTERETAGSKKTYEMLNDLSAYDVIHNNKVDAFSYAWIATLPNCLTTYHQAATESPGLTAAIGLNPQASQAKFVAISDFQRKSIDLNFIGQIYNGIDIGQFDFQPVAETYIAWMARIDPDKGAEDAIQAAVAAGAPLKMAGSKRNQSYYDKIVAMVQAQGIQFMGHVDSSRRNQLLGKALAFIFPTKWAEPFGLVVAEAMACGTPVITYSNGAMSELVVDGVTGFVCPANDIAALAEAIQKIQSMPESQYRAMRAACRARVENNFTIDRMTDQYEVLYATIAKET
jgi:glycosyltransferase involved in cell wall biosynthesis